MFLNYGTIGIRLNNHCRQITMLLPLLRDQIIGHMLGDGCIVYSKTSIIPYFQFIQASCSKLKLKLKLKLKFPPIPYRGKGRVSKKLTI